MDPVRASPNHQNLVPNLFCFFHPIKALAGSLHPEGRQHQILLFLLLLLLPLPLLLLTPIDRKESLLLLLPNMPHYPTTNGKLSRNVYAMHACFFCTFGSRLACSVGAHQQKFLHRSSVGDLSRVHCRLGTHPPLGNMSMLVPHLCNVVWQRVAHFF